MEHQEQQVIELEQVLGAAQTRIAQLEFIEQHTEDWAERLERASRQGDQLRTDLELAKSEVTRLTGELAAGEELRRTVAEQEARIAELSDQRRLAEESVERLVERYSSVSGDAAVLTELLSLHDEANAQLRVRLSQVSESPPSECPPEVEPEEKSTEAAPEEKAPEAETEEKVAEAAPEKPEPAIAPGEAAPEPDPEEQP